MREYASNHDPFRLIYDMLLRPSHAVALLAKGKRQAGAAALATLVWITVWLAFAAPVLQQIAPVRAQELVQVVVLPPALAAMISGMSLMAGGNLHAFPASLFWILRPLLSITPALALLFAFAAGARLPVAAQPQLSVMLLVLVGSWAGVLVALRLLFTSRDRSVALRGLIVCGALLSASALFGAPLVGLPDYALPALVLIGIAIGLVRPMSWLAEAAASLGLVVLSRHPIAPAALLRLHPVRYDELSLLPLPGLATLLRDACEYDSETGIALLIEVGDHPGQGGRALACLNTIAQHSSAAHRVLFAFSTHEDASELLARLAERPNRMTPLLRAYVAFATVPMPEAWPSTIRLHRAALMERPELPGASVMLSLLDTSVAILSADRWTTAIAAARTIPPPPNLSDPIWTALSVLQEWVSGRTVEWAGTRDLLFQELVGELQDDEGWPAALLTAVAEHLVFLVQIERYEGAWLL